MGRCALIQVDGDTELVPDALAEFARVFGGLFHRDARDRNKREHIGRTESRMVALMVPHIDQFLRLFDRDKRRLDDRVRLAGKRHDRPVGRVAGVDIEQAGAVDLFDLVGDLLYHLHVAALTEIRHAFDEFFHTS